jgi:hypothetical protein
MPENNTGAGTAGANNNSGGQGAGAGQGGTDPTKTGTAGTQPFDASKIGDEDFQKIFDDPRLWTHPRFKGLKDRAQLADKLEADKQKAKEAELEKNKQFEALATERGQKLETAILDNKIILEATKAGVVDAEAVLKLVDRGLIKKDDTGNYSGIAEAVKALVEAKTYLKGTGSNTLGSATNPGGNAGDSKYKFKHSQIKDPKFYREHEAEILEALRKGQIENDVPV